MKKRILKILLLIVSVIIGFYVFLGIAMYFSAVEIFENAELDKARRLEQSVQNGDIIFQTSKSSQSKAIQLATASKYSHMGIIYKNEGEFFVYEAVQPVKLTPLIDWINRGEKRHYVIKRLANADEVLTEPTLAKMKEVGEQFKGKPYDIYFEWSDDKIYCSELVWKIYKQVTDIEIGQLQQLSDFDLSNDIVKVKMQERYGNDIPMEEKVISPAAMFNSEKLVLVEEH